MAVKFTDTRYYQEIADAIRAKTGSTLKMTPPEMATEIGNIPSGGDDQLTKYLKGEAISLNDATVTEIPRYGLASGGDYNGAKIQKLVIPGCKTVGYSGMYNTQFLSGAEVDLSGLETIEDYGMACSQAWLGNNPDGLGIEQLNLPSLTEIKQYGFCYSAGKGGTTGTRSLRKINAPALTKIGSYAFQFINSASYIATLEEINCPAVASIGQRAFQNQKALKSFSTDGALYGLSQYAFASCTSLTEFLAKNAGDGPFYDSCLGGCTALELVDVGKTYNFQRQVFVNDAALKYLVMRNRQRRMECTYGQTTVFEGSGITATTGWILVPSNMLNSYKTASGWSTYADRFVALEDYTVDGTTTGDIDRDKLAELG